MIEFLLNALAPFVKLLAQKRLAKGLEERTRISERYGIPSIQTPKDQQVIWFHAASVGEVMSLVSLIRKWHDLNPTHYILLTTTTVTGAKVAESRLGGVCHHQYAPYDVPIWVKKFLNFWKPTVAIFAESEIWPNQIGLLKKRGIPLVLLNARLSPGSFSRWQKISWLAKSIFSKITLCLAQDDVMAKNFTRLGVTKVQAVTNLKFMAEPLPVDKKTYDFFKIICENRPVWVAASTHAGEEDIIIRCHQELAKTIPNLFTFIIPRHPNRIDDVAKLLDQAAISFQRRTQFTPHKPTDICLVDSLGEMGIFYKLADVVFLGGSLVPIGGHNPIEPALFEKPIVWGPFIHKTLGLATVFGDSLSQIHSEAELIQMTQQLLTDPKSAQAQGNAAFEVVQKQAQQLDDIMKSLASVL